MTQHGSPPGWLEENDPAGQNFPDDGCLAEPKAAKPVIKSKHQLRGMPGRSSVISGELQAGGKSLCLCLTKVL
jgi:hypothetical protein